MADKCYGLTPASNILIIIDRLFFYNPHFNKADNQQRLSRVILASQQSGFELLLFMTLLMWFIIYNSNFIQYKITIKHMRLSCQFYIYYQLQIIQIIVAMQNNKTQNKNQQKIPQKKILVFGDSFVKIFDVVKNPNLKYYKYKGATMKGVTRPGNKNRQQIQFLVGQPNIQYLIFNFGQVDYNFSCYYKLIRQEAYDEQQIISQYFKWISELPVEKKFIIVTYPSPLQKETICGALIKYLILTKDQVIQNKQKILMQFENHKIRHEKWRNLYKKYAAIYKSQIRLIDLSNRILDTKDRVRKDYRDINNFNIHILWKKLIIDLKQKFEKFFILQINEEQLRRGEQQYQKNKKKRMRQEFMEYDFLNIQN